MRVLPKELVPGVEDLLLVPATPEQIFERWPQARYELLALARLMAHTGKRRWARQLWMALQLADEGFEAARQRRAEAQVAGAIDG